MTETHAAVRKQALVTGASGGIGAVFARRLADDHDVVLVARSADKLEAMRDELAATHPGGRFTVLVADLGAADGPTTVLDRLQAEGITVDLLINNAGAGYNGAFAEQPPESVTGLVMLDCVAVVALARGLLPGMIARGSGAIVNVASTAGFQPLPGMAIYGAAKAFALSFSEALHVETRSAGVDVLTLCPGATETGFFASAGANFLTDYRQSPEQVVDAALKALAKRRAVAVTGIPNKLGAFGLRFLPRSLVARGSGWLVRAR